MGARRAVFILSRVALPVVGCFIVYFVWILNVKMSDQTLDYFLRQRQIKKKDAAAVIWSHAVNSRSRLTEVLTGPCHMIEADIIMRGSEPIMAHPPQTDSDITLREWLAGVKEHTKGIKLDFKSLEAVSPSLVLLEEVLSKPGLPVWINADILSGPGGGARPLEPQAFLSAVTTLSTNTVLSLGWTTGWTAGIDNPGTDKCRRRDTEEYHLAAQKVANLSCMYGACPPHGPRKSWDMVHEMEEICRSLKHPVTFPVRASLLAQSFSQLSWLLQQSDRYTLTVWTGQNEKLTLEDLLPYRKQLGMSRIYYDLPDSIRAEVMVHDST